MVEAFESNRRAIEAAGLSFILGAKVPDIPYVVIEAGKVPVKRNRFIKLVGADKSVNRTLDPIPEDLRNALARITSPDGTHQLIRLGTARSDNKASRGIRG